MDFQIAYTDEEITPWGGMALMKKMMECAKTEDMLQSLGLPQPGSNRGYRPEQIVKSFWVSIWCGANRFMHTEVTRQDEVIRKIFGWKRMCAQDVYKRYFEKFTQGMNQGIFMGMYRWFFNQLRFDNYTLDLAPTVVTRYGQQEGVKTGYNPKKPGRDRITRCLRLYLIVEWWQTCGCAAAIHIRRAICFHFWHNYKFQGLT